MLAHFKISKFRSNLPSHNGDLSREGEVSESWCELGEDFALERNGGLLSVGAWWSDRAIGRGLVVNRLLLALAMPVADDGDFGVVGLGGGSERSAESLRSEGCWSDSALAGSQSASGEHDCRGERYRMRRLRDGRDNIASGSWLRSRYPSGLVEVATSSKCGRNAIQEVIRGDRWEDRAGKRNGLCEGRKVESAIERGWEGTRWYIKRGAWKAVKGDGKKLASNVGLRWDGDPPSAFSEQ